MIDGPTEAEDLMQAWELLDTTTEVELRKFLSGLVADAGRRSGDRLPDPAARALVDRLARIALQTVPTLTSVLGAGGAEAGSWQSSPTAMASRVYGLSLEGFSAEDRDYEIARQFVRFAQAAATEVAHRAAATSGPAPATANAAITSAATVFAPGLHPPGHANRTPSVAWMRGANAPSEPSRPTAFTS
jgi:hypothetical protein